MKTPLKFIKDNEDYYMEIDYNDTLSLAMREYAKLSIIEELKKHIEHPTKPGYKRLDIVKRIKELENE
jgi:hypothetical protein